MTPSAPPSLTASAAQADLPSEADLQSPFATETLAAESGTGTEDDDDDRDDEHDDENEAPVREVDDATEAPEEFEVDDEDPEADGDEDDADDDDADEDDA
jgi:protein SDA1